MVATIHVPTISAEHVQLGLIDSANPLAAVDNKPFNQLRTSGAMLLDPDDLSAITRGGDRITIPALADPEDFEWVDHASDTPLTPAEHVTKEDVGVIVWNRKLYPFRESDRIRSGFDASPEYSTKLGGKKAKRLFDLAMKVVVGALDAVDTPTGNCHTLNVYAENTPAYPTLERLRQTKALLCDRQEMLTTCVMHSAAFNMLLKDLIATYGGGSIIGDTAAKMGLLGTLLGIDQWIVSDLVPLTDGAYNTLMLGPGAIWVAHQKDLSVDTQRDVKGGSTVDNMAVSFNVCAHLRHVKWIDAGNNPEDADLIDGTNWDEAYDDHRRVLAAKLVSN